MDCAGCGERYEMPADHEMTEHHSAMTYAGWSMEETFSLSPRTRNSNYINSNRRYFCAPCTAARNADGTVTPRDVWIAEMLQERGQTCESLRWKHADEPELNRQYRNASDGYSEAAKALRAGLGKEQTT